MTFRKIPEGTATICAGYGPPKEGKTRSALAGCPTAHVIANNSESVRSQFAALGYDNEGTRARTIHIGNDAEKILTVMEGLVVKAKQGRMKGSAIIFDDFNMVIAGATARRAGLGSVWNAYRWAKHFLTVNLVDLCGQVGVPVIFIMHEEAPREINGFVVQKGRPLLPGVELPKIFPGIPSFIAHVEHDDEDPLWPYHYSTSPSERWVAGDRYDVAPEKCPLNFGEILRQANFDIAMPKKSLPWFMGAVDTITGQLLDDNLNVGEVINSNAIALNEKTDASEEQIIWAINTARSRAQMSVFKKSTLARFLEKF